MIGRQRLEELGMVVAGPLVIVGSLGDHVGGEAFFVVPVLHALTNVLILAWARALPDGRAPREF